MSDQTTPDIQAETKVYKVFVNAEEKAVDSDVVSYEQVVLLAYPIPPGPDTIYSVTFEKAKKPEEGDLVAGQTVEIKEGTEFDVTHTGKS